MPTQPINPILARSALLMHARPNVMGFAKPCSNAVHRTQFTKRHFAKRPPQVLSMRMVIRCTGEGTKPPFLIGEIDALALARRVQFCSSTAAAIAESAKVFSFRDPHNEKNAGMPRDGEGHLWVGGYLNYYGSNV